MSDLQRYAELLAEVERGARGQPWAKQRPWRVRSHVWLEGEVPTVDLHDLSARLARDAVRAVVSAPPDAGAVVFVSGRGRHTVGPGGVLRKVVEKELQRACAEAEGWSYRPRGPGRWVLVTDRDRAPAAVTGALGWGCWTLVAAFALAVAVVVAKLLGLLG